MRKLLSAVLLLLVGGMLFWAVHYRGDSGANRKAFDQAVTEALSRLPADDAAKASPGVLCVRLPDAFPFMHGHPMEPALLGAVVRIPLQPVNQSARRKLDALVQAGLFEQQQGNQVRVSGLSPSLGYMLTLKGWLAADYRNGSPCFVYAHQENLGVSGFSRMEDAGHSGRVIYHVTARLGVRHPEALPDWARSPAVQAAYPSIARNLSGTARDFSFERIGGHWQKVTAPTQSKPVAHSGRDSGDAPADDEIRHLLEGRTDWSRNAYCVALPNGRQDSLPVDRNLTEDRTGHYAVAVFDEDKRPGRDPVLQYSLPYLTSLQQAGVLVRNQVLLPGLRQLDHQEMASVFEFSPAFSGRAVPGRAACLSPGQPDVEVVDVQIYQRANASDLPDGYRYKLRLHFNHPPAWMKDGALQQAWPELAHVLHDGWACQGDFSFDRKTRQPAGGAERCGWAFESVAQME